MKSQTKAKSEEKQQKKNSCNKSVHKYEKKKEIKY